MTSNPGLPFIVLFLCPAFGSSTSCTSSPLTKTFFVLLLFPAFRSSTQCTSLPLAKPGARHDVTSPLTRMLLRCFCFQIHGSQQHVTSPLTPTLYSFYFCFSVSRFRDSTSCHITSNQTLCILFSVSGFGGTGHHVTSPLIQAHFLFLRSQFPYSGSSARGEAGDA